MNTYNHSTNWNTGKKNIHECIYSAAQRARAPFSLVILKIKSKFNLVAFGPKSWRFLCPALISAAVVDLERFLQTRTFWNRRPWHLHVSSRAIGKSCFWTQHFDEFLLVCPEFPRGGPRAPSLVLPDILPSLPTVVDIFVCPPLSMSTPCRPLLFSRLEKTN